MFLPVILWGLLVPVTTAPSIQAEQPRGLRLIVVATEEQATAVRAQILAGSSFDALAREHSTHASAADGGFLGVFASADLRPDFQAAVAGLKPGDVSSVIKMGREFALLQLTIDPAEMLDSFSALLSLAYFRDKQFEETLREFQRVVEQAPVSEDLFLAMNSILSGAELRAEAETLMARALRTFPESRQVRYRLAELHRDSGRMRKALEVFKEASEMKAPPDLDESLDRRQRSFIYQRMGGINTDLVQFDDAFAAYKTALEIDPTNADVRLALSELYLRRDKLDEATKEAARVLSDRPEIADAHNRMAEIHLRMERFQEAAQSAAAALAINPRHRRASYVRGTALVRMGNNDEGQKQLQQYQKLESDAQAEANLSRQMATINRGAASLLLAGRPDEAIAMFRKGVEQYPKAVPIRLNLALAQVKLGRDQDAVKTFRDILDLRLGDSFLIHFNLARLYEKLGDANAGAQHRSLYADALDAALAAGLN